MYCTTWRIQPKIYNNCKWSVTFKNCIKIKKKTKKQKKTPMFLCSGEKWSYKGPLPDSQGLGLIFWSPLLPRLPGWHSLHNRPHLDFSHYRLKIAAPHYRSGLPLWLSSKESACNARDTWDVGLIPGLGRSPGGGHGSPLQYSCWENPMDKGAWRATVHRVVKSLIWLSKCTL